VPSARACVVRLGFAVATSLVVPYAVAEKDTEPASEPTVGPSVRVHVVGALRYDLDLLQLLEEWLGANGIEHDVVRQARLRLDDIQAPRGSGPAVRIWLVALSPHRARLYFAEPDAARYLVRDVPLPSGFDEVGRERIVQVVLTSALAFMDQTAGSSLAEVQEALASESGAPSSVAQPLPGARQPPPNQVQTSPPTADQAPQRPSESAQDTTGWRSSLGGEILYGVTGKGEENIAQGPGLAFELGHGKDGLGLAFRVHGQYRLPHQASSARIRLSIQEAVTAGSMAVQAELQEPFCWRAELGAGAQFVHVEPRALTDDVVARDATWDARPFLLVGTGPAWRTRGIWVRVTARMDVQLGRTRYDVMADGEAQLELVVQRIQPGAFVELGGPLIHF
jgi:hypothetical protein